tara:strand:+ start:7709 stop:7900 length:192 start_codon:yes stop_codon:yes gene_type:complete
MSKRFMFMESPLHALDVIADLIHYQAPLKDQDEWLEACIKLGYVEVEENIKKDTRKNPFTRGD